MSTAIPYQPDPNLVEEIHLLAYALLTRSAIEGQRERLEALVCNDDAAYDLYVNYIHESVAIRSQAGDALLPLLGVRPGASHSHAREGIAPSELFVSPADMVKSGLDSELPRKGRSKMFRLWWALSATATCSCLLALSWVFQRSEANTPVRSAKVARVEGARWQLDGREISFKPGEMLTTGRYTLLEGLAQIVFPWGTTVTMQGPTEFEFGRNGTRYLHRGQLMARVSPDDGGFTIETPTVRVIDLGTEFGLSTDSDGATEVHVFKGAVEARMKPAYIGANSQPIKVLAREATSFGGIDPGNHQVVFNPNRFANIFKMSSRISSTQGSLRFVHPPPANLSEGHTESSENLLLFCESQGVQLLRPMEVTLTSPGLYNSFTNLSAWLPNGLSVDSYLVHFDPVGSNPDQPVVSVRGSVTFDRMILGVICRGDQLAATDSEVGCPGVQYLQTSAYFPSSDSAFQISSPPFQVRGLVGVWSSAHSPRQSPAPNDMIGISQDRRTLTIKCTAGGEANQLRILIAASDEIEVPNEFPALKRSPMPYHGSPFKVGDIIQAEDFDVGGEGVAYVDSTSDSLSAVYRPDESVELISFVSSDKSVTLVHKVRAGESLCYTVDIDAAGFYAVEASVGSEFGESLFRFDFLNKVWTEPLRISATPRQEYLPAMLRTLRSSPVQLDAGRHTLRVLMEEDGSHRWIGLFDWFRIVRINDPSPSTAELSGE